MLELHDVTYRYPGAARPAISGIDLRVEGGEILGLVGPNEAGKSTVCLVASGLAPASIGGELAGSVQVDGRDLPRGRAGELAGVVGIVFDDPASQRSGITATVFEEVAFGPINLGLPVAETVWRSRVALGAVGIEHLAERHPARLSGGQAQLVAIASVLAMQPGCLVLDEPAAELDPDATSLLIRALQVIAESGTPILIAEHRRDVVGALGARIVALEGGRVAR